MNIFAIERDADGGIDWIASAKSQDNYRVVKMILESTQMLCTTINELAGEQVTPYRSTHKNHPSTKWVRESSYNFQCLDDTPLPLCMPDEFKTDDVVTSYRKFYASKPKMRYAKSKVPPWFSSFRTEKFELLP